MDITVSQMMEIEERGDAMGFAKKLMMENAGAAAVRRLASERGELSGRAVLIVAGTGNNGGDGLVMARHLAGLGAHPSVHLVGDASSIRTGEARWNWDLVSRMRSVRIVGASELGEPDIIVDAVLGTGVSGAPREPHAGAISLINASRAYKAAVDVPSGLDATSGSAAGACVEADMTVTFHRAKAGMRGAPQCGRLFVEPIGIPPEAEDGVL